MTVQEVRRSLGGIGGRSLVAILCAMLLAPADGSVFAQETPPAAEPEAAKLTNDELDSLVAPIALYPDPLLAQCLVASTYPLDIVDAQQWLSKNSSLKGDALEKAAQQEDWDASVQALVALPDALKRLSENIKWTTNLGDAFLAQQSDVMDAVQRLRAKAKEGGKLESSEQQKVETTTVETKTVIEIQPASTEVVYVPSYSPTAVWGAPPYPYPPMYYPPYVPGQALLSFGVGMMWGAAISGGFGWGCGWHGGGNNTVNINNNNNFVNNSNRQNNVNRSGNSNWQHNAKQRGGVPYKDKATAGKYGGGTRGDSASARQSQARQRQGQSAERGGGSRSGGDRSGTSGSRGGGDRSGARSSSHAGSRDLSSSSRSRSSGSSAFSGSSQSRSRASSSSARGSSSMSGGGSRGGGGGRRR